MSSLNLEGQAVISINDYEKLKRMKVELDKANAYISELESKNVITIKTFHYERSYMFHRSSDNVNKYMVTGSVRLDSDPEFQKLLDAKLNEIITTYENRIEENNKSFRLVSDNYDEANKESKAYYKMLNKLPWLVRLFYGIKLDIN